MRVGAWIQPAAVAAHEAHLELRSDFGDGGVSTRPGVVDQVGAAMTELSGDLRSPRVHADDEAGVCRSHPVDEGSRAPQLRGDVDGIPVSGFDPADVDQVSAFGDHLVDSVIAAESPKAFPPSWNESGVRLTIAITAYSNLLIVRPPSTRDTAAPYPQPRTQAVKRGTIESVIWFWVVALVLIIGASAVIIAGRGDAMADVYEDRPDLSVGRGALTADEVARVRFTTAVRGYRMDEVDAFVERLEADLRARSTTPSPDEEVSENDHECTTEPDSPSPEPGQHVDTARGAAGPESSPKLERTRPGRRKRTVGTSDDAASASYVASAPVGSQLLAWADGRLRRRKHARRAPAGEPQR